MANIFTTRYSIRVPALVTNIELSLPSNSVADKRIESKAIWDTGATNSVITEKLAKELNLQPISKVNVVGVHGSEIKNAYLINIYLPSKVCINYARVTECKQLSGTDDLGMLIGMDIIGLGDLAVTNFNKTVLSYRLPSKHEIDFLKDPEINPAHSDKISRNSLCPCGSGKKYKKCCGK